MLRRGLPGCTGPSKPMLRSRLRDLALAILMAGALLLALEGVARLLEPEDLRTQAQRLQALPPKPPDSDRIFLFGSSSVFGHPVPELGFVAQLDYWLQRTAPEGRRIEVHNFAVPGVASEVVLETVEAAMDWEPDLVVVHTGWGEFLRDEDAGAPADELRRALQRRSALFRLARRAAFRARDDEDEAALPLLARPIDREGPYYRSRVARYQTNLAKIVERVGDAGVPLLLATLTVNLADWEPTNELVAPHLYAGGPLPPFSQIRSFLRIGGHEAAEELSRAALERFPGDALLLYLRGRALAAAGDSEAARTMFEQAHARDPIPWRPPREIQDSIRRASTRPGVTLVDVRERLEARSPGRLLGREMILDNAHPTPRGSAVIAELLLQTLAAEIGLIAPDAEPFRSEDPLAPFLEHAQRAAAPRDLIAEMLKDSARYCMVGRYRHYDAAARYLREWIQHSPGDWRPWANLASISFLRGQRAQGLHELRLAIRLHGGVEGIARRSEAPYLQDGLEAAGIELEKLGG